MSNQLHYSVECTREENNPAPRLSLPTDQICLIDDCFDDMIGQKTNQTTLNDVA